MAEGLVTCSGLHSKRYSGMNAFDKIRKVNTNKNKIKISNLFFIVYDLIYLKI